LPFACVTHTLPSRVRRGKDDSYVSGRETRYRV
jgi:hypothetical protein